MEEIMMWMTVNQLYIQSGLMIFTAFDVSLCIYMKCRPPAVRVSNEECPKCGSGMHLQTGRYGEFFGCDRFLECKGSRSIA